MERPTKEIKLPNSKYKVEIITYFTRGEFRQYENEWKTKGELKYVDGQMVLDNLPPEFISIQEDSLLKYGVKKVFNDKGEEVSKDVLETLNELPNDDVAIVLNELNKVIAEDKQQKKG